MAIQFALMITLLVVPWRKPEPVSIIIGIAVLVGGLTLGVLSFRALGSALFPEKKQVWSRRTSTHRCDTRSILPSCSLRADLR